MRIQTLDLNFETDDDIEPGPDENPLFWRRQFQQESTHRQRLFDWAYGVVIPTICVAADPIVFKGGFGGGGILGEYRPFAYMLSFASILSMIAWLLWGKKVDALTAPIAGLFLIGGGISLLVGIVIFPFSLIGLFFLIGFLGFTPLFSAIVYLRNGVRAFRYSKLLLEPMVAVRAGILAAGFGLVIPYVTNVAITDSVSKMTYGDVSTIRSEAAKLRFVWPLGDFSSIADRYRSNPEDEDLNSPRMKELKKAYEDLTGDKLESYSHLD